MRPEDEEDQGWVLEEKADEYQIRPHDPVSGACSTNRFVLSLCGLLAGYHREGTLIYMGLRSK